MSLKRRLLFAWVVDIVRVLLLMVVFLGPSATVELGVRQVDSHLRNNHKAQLSKHKAQETTADEQPSKSLTRETLLIGPTSIDGAGAVGQSQPGDNVSTERTQSKKESDIHLDNALEKRRNLQVNGFYMLLRAGEQIVNDEFTLIPPLNMQLKQESNGNLVLCSGTDGICDETIYWQSGCTDDGAVKSKLQRDGHLLSRDANKAAVWRTGVTSSNGDYFMAVTGDSSKLVIHSGTVDNPGFELWSNELQQDGTPPSPSPPSPTTPIFRTCLDADQRPSVDPSDEILINFYAMGDTPYNINQRYCLNEQLRQLNLEQDGAAFIAHVGDIKVGKGSGSECTANVYQEIANIFSHPNNMGNYDVGDVLMLVGDNEWTDCADPDEAWGYWMENFGPNSTFASNIPSLARQSGVFRTNFAGTTEERTENLAFFVNGVLFLAINMMGSFNGIRNSPVGDEAERLGQNLNWVTDQMEAYAPRGMEAVVIFAHAPFEGSIPRDHFGNPFKDLLRDTYDSEIPTLYVHGDGHAFCYKYPDNTNPNLVGLMVDDGNDAPPLLVSVRRRPSDGQVFFHVDERGGLYGSGGCNPSNIQENTWL